MTMYTIAPNPNPPPRPGLRRFPLPIESHALPIQCPRSTFALALATSFAAGASAATWIIALWIF